MSGSETWESYLAMNGWVILQKGNPTPLLHTHSDDTGPEVNVTVREHNRIVRDLRERLAAMAPVESILRDLASLDPAGEDFGAGPECVLCQAFKLSHVNEPAGPPELEDHDENCPWRRAVEWVSTQEDQT